MPDFNSSLGFAIETSTLKTRLFGSAEGEIAVTRPVKVCGKASVVMICDWPTLTRLMEVSGTPKTALTVRVSAIVKPVVAGLTKLPTSTLRFTIHPSKGASSEQ